MSGPAPVHDGPVGDPPAVPADPPRDLRGVAVPRLVPRARSACRSATATSSTTATSTARSGRTRTTSSRPGPRRRPRRRPPAGSCRSPERWPGARATGQLARQVRDEPADDPRQARAGLGAGRQDLLVGQRLAACSRRPAFVTSETPQTSRPTQRAAMHSSTVDIPTAWPPSAGQHPDLGRGLVRRARSGRRRRPPRASTPSAAAGGVQARSAAAGSRRRSGPGSAARARRRCGPMSGFRPVRLMWSAMTMSVPGPNDGSRPPAAFVRTTILRARARWNSRTGWMTRPGSLPSYRWKRPWSMTTGRPPSVPEQQPPDVPRRGRGRPAGQLRERDRDGVLEVVGEAAEPRARARSRPRARVASARGRPPTSASRRAGCSVGRDRARRVDGGSGRVGHAGLQDRVQGVDGRGPRLRRPDGSIDTGMPITSRRARPRRAAVVRRPPDAGNEAPEATGGGTKVLDVISVPSVLSAPSGKTYGTGRRRRTGQRGYPRTSGATRDGVSTTSSTLWISLWTNAGPASRGRGSAAHREHLDLGQVDRRRRAQLRVAVVAARPDRRR